MAEPIDKMRGKRDRLIRERDNMVAVNLRDDIEALLAELVQVRLIVSAAAP